MSSPPSPAPTALPTSAPSSLVPAPTALETLFPTPMPSPMPSLLPTTPAPSSQQPTREPSRRPSRPPTPVPSPLPTLLPSTMLPTLTALPTPGPTPAPSAHPTLLPTPIPTVIVVIANATRSDNDGRSGWQRFERYVRRNRTSALFLSLYPVVGLLVLLALGHRALSRRRARPKLDEERKDHDDDDDLVEDVPADPPRDIEAADRVRFHASLDTILGDFRTHMDKIDAPAYHRAGWHTAPV